MDPTTCLSSLVECLRQEDYEGAEERASDFLEWVGKGGFVPEWPGAIKKTPIMPRSSKLAILIDAVNRHLGVEDTEDLYK